MNYIYTILRFACDTLLTKIKMKRNIAITFLILLQSYSVAETFLINGKEIIVPAPEGFVRVTDDMTAMMKFVQQMEDPMNDTLAYYIMKSSVPAALAGEIPNSERTFQLKVNKQLRNMTVGNNYFSELKSMTKRQNQKMLENVKAQISEHIKKMNIGVSQEFNVDYAMKISQAVLLEPHYEAENALAFSMYLNFGFSAGEEKMDQIISGTSTLLNTVGTVLFLHCYASKDELKWTRDASMKWSNSVMISNTQPPAKR